MKEERKDVYDGNKTENMILLIVIFINYKLIRVMRTMQIITKNRNE